MNSTLMIADTSRLRPDDLPLKPMGFKRWADHACVEWPVDLTAKSAHVTGGTYFLWDQDKFDEFVPAYTEWYAMSEGQKELLMSDDQIKSTRRHFNRVKARLAAHA